MSEPIHRHISGLMLLKALADADVIRIEDKVRRVVIDATIGEGLKVYVERWGDERLLQLAQTLEGVEISGVPSDDTAPE